MAKEKLTYETKMLRHAGRELDKYWDDFHTTPAFIKLIQETTWVGDATSQARSTLTTFFATAFANLRSSIAKLDIPQIVDGLEQTLEASANSDDPYADIDFDADVIRAMIMWLIQQKKIQLTSDDFMTALIQALTETTTHAAISQYADYADYDDDDEAADDEDDDYDAEIEKALADVGNDPEFEEKAIDFSSPQTQSLLDLLPRFIESSAWDRLPEKVQDPDLLTMLVLLIMQSNKVMFNHEIKAWTKEELSTSLTFILSDKEIIKVNRSYKHWQRLFVQLPIKVSGQQNKSKILLKRSMKKLRPWHLSHQRLKWKQKKDNKPTVGRVVPMKKFEKGKYKKWSFVEAGFKPSCCVQI